MAKIKRRKLETNYTVVENDFLRDRELGLTERGLLMTMLSLPDNWDYSAQGLASILPDGKKKTNNSLQRLEQAGYLKRSRLYENGKVVDWLYEFCEQPIFKDENLLTQKGDVDENLLTPFVQVEKVEVEKVKVQNGSDNKRTKKSNTKKSNTLLNQSINQEEGSKQKAENENKNDRLIDKELIQEIKEQIQFDYLLQEFDQEDLQGAVDAIAVLKTASIPQKFGEATYEPGVVRSRADQLTQEHVEYVLTAINQQYDKISNMPKYLVTSLFNAVSTYGLFIRNQINSDVSVKGNVF